MEEQERHTDRFLWSKKIEKHKKKSKLFFRKMPYLSAYLNESLDFFKVGILGAMNSIRNRAEEIILKELIYGEDAV